MKRRSFIARAAGGAAASVLPFLHIKAVPASACAVEPQMYQLIRPSAPGNLAPPPSDFHRGRRRQFGTLSPENAESFVEEMANLFGDKKLAVAHFHGEEWTDIRTDAELIADWTDHSTDLAKARVDDEGRATIYFSCGGFFYTFDSSPPYKQVDDKGVFHKNAYFSFEGDKLTVRQRNWHGILTEYLFRIQYEGSDYPV